MSDDDFRAAPCTDCGEDLLDKDEELFGNIRLCQKCADGVLRQFRAFEEGRP